MKAIIIDDEQLAIDVLEILLKKTDVEIVGSYTSPHEALKELANVTVDLIFLDMEMGELHGLEFAEVLLTTYPEIEIVFVTAHPQFALEAFEVNAIDYLLKPVDEERLQKTMHKLKRRVSGQATAQMINKTTKESLYAEVMGGFRLLHQAETEVKWRTKKVKELFAFLWQYQDTGIHRSQIIMELWPELSEDRASALMHTTIYQLRKTLRMLGFKDPVTLKNEQYKLNVPVQSDLNQLKRMISAKDIDQHSVEKSIRLYQGDYLSIEDYQWAFSAQEKVRRLFLTYLEKYVSLTKISGQQNELLENCLKKMIDLDPYNIQYTCLLLVYYGDQGSTQKVITLFQEAKLKWMDELGLDMPREIVERYHKYI